ncbi:helix-hairpin-helix domain-containing protein [Clostridium cochlearium]|uniref:helix-hairpin-helix domain-containing protein n=1 Tax=Clostridium cochlearium TaxID=1494 RepID=UPI003140BBEA
MGLREKEDLLKLKGINKRDTEMIIAYRDKNKYFKDVKEFGKIERIREETVETLKSSSSEEKFKKVTQKLENSLSKGKFQKSFSNIFYANFEHLIFRTLIWFIIFFITYYVLIVKNPYKEKSIY